MRNFLMYCVFVTFLLITCQDREIIDRSHYETPDCVESADEMMEIFFPEFELPDSTIDATDSLIVDSALYDLLEDRFDSLGYHSFGDPDLQEGPKPIGKKTLYLNIHCTATKEGADISGEWLEDFFANDRGWRKNGYNEVVLLDGGRYTMEPYNLDGYTTWDEVSYGVRGRNAYSINIAYVGGVDSRMNPKDTRTVDQKRSIDQIVHEIKCAMPWIKIQGHRDNPNVAKACPSFDVETDYKDRRVN